MKEATLKVDPDVKIPAAVRAAAARSDEIFNAIKAQTEEGQVTDQSNEPPANPELNAASMQEPPKQDQTDNKPAPAPALAPATQEDESWEHRYKSMKGRFDRSQEQLKHMGEQITNLQNVIASMQASAPVRETPVLTEERFITDDDIKDYGPEFLDVVGKKAKQELVPIVKQYEAKIADLEAKLQGVQGVVVQDAQSKMYEMLDTKMPNWRELNYNSEFLDWLKLPDPYSGVIRHEMLKAAYAQSDARRVLAFFNGFLAEEAAVAPGQTTEPDTKTTTVPKVPLETLAAPGRAKTAAGSNGTPAEKPIFTRAQIAAFYADVAAGKFRGRDADKNKFEVQIFEAQREGRIR